MRITLTGLDEKTDIAELIKRVETLNNPTYAMTIIEFGVLLSEKPEGRNRYPSQAWIREQVCEYFPMGLAIHLCGKLAIQHALDGDYHNILDYADRIQVNGKVTPEQLYKFCQIYPYTNIITQHIPYNYDLLNCDLGNQHCLLVDASGGNGILPSEWIAPESNKRFGFAGGLGPHNLKEQLPKLQKGNWIDMETNIRYPDIDLFSIDKAIECIKIVQDRQNV